ncbi:MAG: CDP-tyvelose epimerase [Terriglobia bacterium]|nr:MAG: CDP-tyvelose epimerase [Terriglobia bacterium]
MRILITGICGFVGSSLARYFQAAVEGIRITGIDNLVRPGSEANRSKLRADGIEVFHGDVRVPSDLEELSAADWVIDAAANPSVLAGVDGRSTSRQLVEHNLMGTVNLLEYCKRHNAGLLLLSTSRVYSIPALASVPIRVERRAFVLDAKQPLPPGLSAEGISESFSVAPPVSLYGSTKLASETLALEYGSTFGFPVWVNRCGVLAGAGQFGTAEQGIFSYWMHAHAARRPLRYIGFGGAGYQVRDAFHPEDLARLLLLQIRDTQAESDRVYNAGGGAANSMSLAELTSICEERFGPHAPQADSRVRPFDLPWVVMDSGKAKRRFGWEPRRTLASILDEIAEHVHTHPGWLNLCEGMALKEEPYRVSTS